MNKYSQLATSYTYKRDRRELKNNTPTQTHKKKPIFGFHNYLGGRYPTYISTDGNFKHNIKRLKTIITDILATTCEDIRKLQIEKKNMRDLRGISKLSSYKRIDIVGGRIVTIPDEITKLSNSLENLGLFKNQIKCIDVLSNCKLLNHLNVCSNKIEVLPKSFENLKLLTILDLSNNKICELPNIVMNVAKLYLQNNKLKDVSILESWKKLTEVDISNNNIQKLPKFQNIKILKAHHNNLSGDVDLMVVSNLNIVKLVNLSYNKIKRFYSSTRIFDLYLNNNELVELPVLPLGMENLNELQLNHNYIKNDITDRLACIFITLPDGYQHIHMCHNSFRYTIGFNISSSLRVLALSYNYIIDLRLRQYFDTARGTLSHCTFIRDLYLDNNLLNNCEVLQYQKKLQLADLKYNQLTVIPDINNNVSHLNISNNSIKCKSFVVPQNINMFIANNNKINTIQLSDSSHANIIVDKSTTILGNTEYATITRL